MSYKIYKLLKVLMLLLTLGPCAPLWAQINLWTTHPQVAYDLNQMAKVYSRGAQVSFKAHEIYQLKDSTDIHQFQPTSTELKKLLNYSPLVVGPLTHQPWLRLAKKSGLLPPEQSLVLDQLGATDHYWLNKKEALNFEKKVKSFLNKLKVSVPQNFPWSEAISKEQDKIKDIIFQKNIKKVVLAHDALVPLFKSIPNLELIVLYSGDHHREVGADTLKSVYQWAKDPSEVLFIYEKNITWPTPLKAKRFEKIRKIQWTPVAPSPIENLRKNLEANL